MPAPTEHHILILGPAVLPFERRNFDRDMQDGEEIHFVDHLYRIFSNGKVRKHNIIMRKTYKKFLQRMLEKITKLNGYYFS